MINWLTDLARYSALAGQAPKDPARWVQRGNHLIEGSEFAAAKIDFERALKLNPKFTPAHIGQAHLLLQQGQHDAALAECETALKLEATEAGYSMRGDVYLKMGQYDRAIEDFAAAKRYDATVAEAFMLRSKQKREQGQAEQADADMQQAIALDPNLDTSRN